MARGKNSEDRRTYTDEERDAIIRDVAVNILALAAQKKQIAEEEAEQRSRLKAIGIPQVTFNAELRLFRLEGEERKAGLSKSQIVRNALMPGEQGILFTDLPEQRRPDAQRLAANDMPEGEGDADAVEQAGDAAPGADHVAGETSDSDDTIAAPDRDWQPTVDDLPEEAYLCTLAPFNEGQDAALAGKGPEANPYDLADQLRFDAWENGRAKKVADMAREAAEAEAEVGEMSPELMVRPTRKRRARNGAEEEAAVTH